MRFGNIIDRMREAYLPRFSIERANYAIDRLVHDGFITRVAHGAWRLVPPKAPSQSVIDSAPATKEEIAPVVEHKAATQPWCYDLVQSDYRKLALEYIFENPGVTLAQISEFLECKPENVGSDLRLLKQRGFVRSERVAGSPAHLYYVTDSPAQPPKAAEPTPIEALPSAALPWYIDLVTSSQYYGKELRFIHTHPGTTSNQIALAIGRLAAAVSADLCTLREKGFVRSEPGGARIGKGPPSLRFYIAPVPATIPAPIPAPTPVVEPKATAARSALEVAMEIERNLARESLLPKPKAEPAPKREPKMVVESFENVQFTRDAFGLTLQFMGREHLMPWRTLFRLMLDIEPNTPT